MGDSACPNSSRIIVDSFGGLLKCLNLKLEALNLKLESLERGKQRKALCNTGKIERESTLVDVICV